MRITARNWLNLLYTSVAFLLGAAVLSVIGNAIQQGLVQAFYVTALWLFVFGALGLIVGAVIVGDVSAVREYRHGLPPLDEDEP